MTASAGQRAGARSKAPVFVLGCGRSGTTLLYHMLLSSGNFAVYRAESQVWNVLEPRFGDLSAPRNRQKLLQAWLNSRLFTATNLEAGPMEAKVMAECGNAGDFLRLVMGEMARQQGVERWAECTPDHLLYLARIKQTIPDALVIHVIRDGRDVALSMEKQGWIRPFPWHKKHKLAVAGLYWEWIVRKGREEGRRLEADYMEVHFEDLVSRPQETLAKLSPFLEHDLDYERIQRVGIGSVSEPNTSFKTDPQGGKFSPVGRWKKDFARDELAMFEGLVGATLEDLGYALETSSKLRGRASWRRMRKMYRLYFDSKLYLKTKTPLGRLLVTRDLSWM